jgi:hypothetical protein
MSQHKKVIYRGVSMIEGWPDKIVEAQSILTCEVRGKQVPRIRYGTTGVPTSDHAMTAVYSKASYMSRAAMSNDAPAVADSDSIATANLTKMKTRMTPNYAFERSVTGWLRRAAGAQTIIAPAARRPRLARPAQRGR